MQSKCLSTTPVCAIEIDVNYMGNAGMGLNQGPGTEVGTVDAPGCKAFCKKTYHDAKYFTWNPPVNVTAGDKYKCWCKTDFENRENGTGAVSGSIYCDDSGKMMYQVTFREHMLAKQMFC